ncbi:MAG: hypothetical protein ICV59_09730 [Thermoleophilia bacterium]|nr:hypothetical protein [Thermoleophilia bacterium]
MADLASYLTLAAPPLALLALVVASLAWASISERQQRRQMPVAASETPRRRPSS